MALQYFDNHPEPDQPYWTVRYNLDKDQKAAMFKKIVITNSLGGNAYAYLVYNQNGNLIAIQTLEKPDVKSPEISKDVEKGMKIKLKIPPQFGLFPPYKVLKSLLKNENS